MRSIIHLILALAPFSLVMAEVTPVVDITRIAGRSQPNLIAYLGEPVSCKEIKYGSKCQYVKGKTTVVFINGKADWLTVEELQSVPFSPVALEAIGLTKTEPTFSNVHVLRWEPLNSLRSIAIFPNGPNTDYAYIKVSTD